MKRIAVATAITPRTIAWANKEKCGCILSLIPPFLGLERLVGMPYQLVASLHQAQLKVLSLPIGWLEEQETMDLLGPSIQAHAEEVDYGVFLLRPIEKAETTYDLLKELFPSLRVMSKTQPSTKLSNILLTAHDSLMRVVASIHQADQFTNTLIVTTFWDDELSLRNLQPEVTLAYLPRNEFLEFLARRMIHELMLEFGEVQFVPCLEVEMPPSRAL